MSATFNRWLRAQATRKDPVGDLARDFCADRPAESGIRVTCPGDLARRLEWHGACAGAYEALGRAEAEWLEASR